ncbi:FAD-binding oxidoreductase [Limnohabitans sp. JirII-29]|uniref:FAD-binding oxidoreductase n=1 Tax=Limnohabitans sp. JirII-29 TaxID=1835756 RepID=UPI000D3AAEFC|nr:FAD-binding oxidoreductase [Limnohabitans sp. JirII-29]PUE29138.1 FAD-binding oxidoreductase [Limnohabitans sp. JirII-29]
MKPVSAWGRLSNDLHEVQVLSDRTQVAAVLTAHQPGLAYGNGRSYGDVCLNPHGRLWHTSGLNKLIAFDETTGLLVCESGVLLRDIQRLFVPRGWMLPVTPGTQLITVGGAVANDVHGKNHHVVGSFGDHVLGVCLARTNGELLQLNWVNAPALMSATIGGMGLTGVIVTVELQLRRVGSPWLRTETLPYQGLSEFFELADASENDWEHTVSWIDCLSGQTARGIFMRANHMTSQEAATMPSLNQALATHPRKAQGSAMSMPFVPPISFVNGLSLKPFNMAYYQLQKLKHGFGVAHYEPFLYPLDNLQDWNRMYGPHGFYQYQSLVPREVGQFAVQAMLDAIAASGEGSFLAVLKTFGTRQAKGMLSFPQPGVTLALDFPNRGERTLKLFERLDAIVREARGRLYMAKDARMPRDLFEAGYPCLPEFTAHRDAGISSAMSRRLMEF